MLIMFYVTFLVIHIKTSGGDTMGEKGVTLITAIILSHGCGHSLVGLLIIQCERCGLLPELQWHCYECYLLRQQLLVNLFYCFISCGCTCF